MQLQQTTQQRALSVAANPATPDDGAGEALAACRRLSDAADEAIDKAYSGDAEAFLTANRQSGGQ